MSREQGSHVMGMRPAAIASGRRQCGSEYMMQAKEAEA